MGTLTTAGKTLILTSGVPSTGWYLALVNSDPSAFTTMSQVAAAEVSVAGYARVAITNGTPSGGSVANTNALATPALTGANNTTALVGYAIVTASSGTSGTLVAVGTVSGADLTPAANEAPKIAAGALTIAL